jgi:methionyl-tRNA synthetase
MPRLVSSLNALCSTDEHGQKIANTAAAQGKLPIELCDFYALGFQALNQRLLISNDEYIRTTMEYHHRNAQELWKKCHEAGDIYLSQYEGWYNEREETFVSEAEAKASDFKDQTSGVCLKHCSEESYFFRMSKYHDALVQYIQANPEFIQPANHRNAILSRLREPLLDLSISRTSFSWGIPVPEGFKENHVMYVWFDALSNYVSGVHGLEDHELARFWPANAHIIGKDIVWFHCVIWPCMLMSAGVALPKAVFAHGFVNAEDGRKMSKSLNNTVDPHELLDKYPVDSIRYYMCQAPYGSDLNLSEASLVQIHNSELADKLGNLVHRALNLCQRYCNGLVADVPYPTDEPLPFDLARLKTVAYRHLQEFAIHGVCFESMQAARDANKYLSDNEPWKLKGEEFNERRAFLVRISLEAIYIVAHFLGPMLPQACASIFEKLNTPPIPIDRLDDGFKNLSVGTSVTVGDILFTKIGEENEEEKIDLAKAKEEKKLKQKQSKTSRAAEEADLIQPDFTKIDLRVGRIVKVTPYTVMW